MDCDRANDFMMRYMDGELSQNDANDLSLHFETCKTCKSDFILYDQILSDFSGLEIINAPEGFEAAVMSKINELPSISAKVVSTIENMMCLAWGAFSVLFGFGFLAVINRETILAYVYSKPEYSTFATVLTYVSDYMFRFSTNLVTLTNDLLATTAGYITSSRFVLLGIFATLAVAQYVMHQRDKVEAS